MQQMMKKLPGVGVDVKPASLTSDHVVRESVCVFTEEFKWFSFSVTDVLI